MTLFDRTISTLLILVVSFFVIREVDSYYGRSLEPRNIVVSVTGEVLRPGVVQLPSDCRMIHAIERCGGLTSQADVQGLELARPLTDGEHMSVPCESKSRESFSAEGVEGRITGAESSHKSTRPISEKSASVSAPSELPPVKRRRNRSASGTSPLSRPKPRRSRTESVSREELQVKVDVNRANLDDLMGIPGVGPVMARRILEARQARNGGSFGSLEELATIRGIKEKTLSRLRPYLKIEGS